MTANRLLLSVQEIGREQGQRIFLIALLIYVPVAVFSQVQGIREIFLSTGFLYFIRRLVFLMLVLKIALDGFKVSMSQGVILLLAALQFFFSGGGSLLYLLTFALAARDVSLRTISKILLLTIAISVSVIVLLTTCGITADYVITDSGWRGERHSLGFRNPNTLACYVLALIYASFVVFEKKRTMFLSIFAIALSTFIVTKTRSLFFGVVVLVLSYLFFQNSSRKVRRAVLLSFPLLVVLHLFFLYQFSYGPLETKLDEIVSSRFSCCVCPVLQNSPITLFGDLSLLSKGAALFAKNGATAFDNSYAKCVLVCGVIGTTIFVLTISLGLLRNSNNTKLLALCTAVCFMGCIESIMFNPVVAFPLLKILADGMDIFPRKEEVTKPFANHNFRRSLPEV